VGKTKRVSHSLLDPLFFPLVQPLYRALPIPRWFPPEGIIAVGHLCAIGGAVGLAFALRSPWWALLGAAGPALSHLCDMVDGTHARATNQCRNGGELLDHFVDPLAFSYWAVGLSIGAGLVWWGMAGVVIIFATTVLTNIKAKITGEFTMARFGSTETRTLLVAYGAVQAAVASLPLARWFLIVLVVLGGVTLVVMLVQAVREVNSGGPAPDSSPWELGDHERSGAFDDLNDLGGKVDAIPPLIGDLNQNPQIVQSVDAVLSRAVLHSENLFCLIGGDCRALEEGFYET
jgi:phosphatidylglycerophosphate synthase